MASESALVDAKVRMVGRAGRMGAECLMGTELQFRKVGNPGGGCRWVSHNSMNIPGASEPDSYMVKTVCFVWCDFHHDKKKNIKRFQWQGNQVAFPPFFLALVFFLLFKKSHVLSECSSRCVIGWHCSSRRVLRASRGRAGRLQAAWWQRAAAAPPGSRPSLLADVKPSNVLINALGQVKMCDFGISGYLVDSVAKTIDAGCKPYMAVSTAPGGGVGSAAAFKPCQETRPGRPRREHWNMPKAQEMSYTFFLLGYLLSKIPSPFLLLH